jgi:D-alanyl-D-alanine dipeptidase
MKFFLSLSVLAAIVTVAQSADIQPIAVPLVDLKLVDPTIVIELRYATTKNITGHALYSPNTQALVRPEVAQRLSAANKFLQRYNYRLKIWDAYRPQSAQTELWKASKNNDYVANPDAGAGSLHKWGIAVDATLTDTANGVVSMPTDYDDFTPAAMWRYQGSDPAIRLHLTLLQVAMRDAGFYGLRSEWWHFTMADWRRFLPAELVKRAEESFGPKWQGKL